MYETLTFLLDNIYIRFGSKLYRQIVGIPMGTDCAPLVADLFCSVMRETLCCLFQRITNLILLKLSRVGRKPSETDSVKSQISSKTSRGEKHSTKDAINVITSDSQVNSYFPYRRTPACLTINIYFYLFLYLYITKKNDKKRHTTSKITKEPKQKSHIGTSRTKSAGGGLQLVCGRLTLAISSAMVPQTLSCSVCVEGS